MHIAHATQQMGPVGGGGVKVSGTSPDGDAKKK